MSDVNRSYSDSLRGPVLMITIGALFLLDRSGFLRFGQSWPLILIVLGVLAFMGHNERRGRAVPPYPNSPPPYPNNAPDYPNEPPPPPPPGVRR
jgi:hypothetical protein